MRERERDSDTEFVDEMISSRMFEAYQLFSHHEFLERLLGQSDSLMLQEVVIHSN